MVRFMILLTFTGQRIFRRYIWDMIPNNIKNGLCYDMEMGINEKYLNI